MSQIRVGWRPTLFVGLLHRPNGGQPALLGQQLVLEQGQLVVEGCQVADVAASLPQGLC